MLKRQLTAGDQGIHATVDLNDFELVFQNAILSQISTKTELVFLVHTKKWKFKYSLATEEMFALDYSNVFINDKLKLSKMFTGNDFELLSVMSQKWL